MELTKEDVERGSVPLERLHKQWYKESWKYRFWYRVESINLWFGELWWRYFR